MQGHCSLVCLIIARIQRSLSCDNSTSNHKKMVNQTMFCTLYKSLDALKLHTCNSHSNWNRISHLGITWNGTPHLVGMECHTWEWLGKEGEIDDCWNDEISWRSSLFIDVDVLDP